MPRQFLCFEIGLHLCNYPGESASLPSPQSVEAGSIVHHHLSTCRKIEPPKRVSVAQIVEKSSRFPIKFPIETVRCWSLLKDKDLSEDDIGGCINSTYPLLHENALYLFIDFLEYKKKYGSSIEKEEYAEMNVICLVNRLLTKRSVTFMNSHDYYLLIDGKSGTGGWEKVGTEEEIEPLLFKNCLSYDEMKLSALLSVSSHTIFINDGDRYNEGIVDESKNHERTGVIIGLIGARLEKQGVMECEEVLVTDDHNILSNGYGLERKDEEDQKLKWRRIWAKFYGIPDNFVIWKEANELFGKRNSNVMPRFLRVPGDFLFDDTAFQKRITVSIETLLLEAQHRGRESGKSVYLHVVGIGLGVWRISDHQGQLFLDAFAHIYSRLVPILYQISDIQFAWFKETRCGGIRDGALLGGARVHFSKDPPHKMLTEDKLLVVSYAWDGNALPGNEFWIGSLSGSGDPAAACSSQVAELHNGHINAKVCGENLHIASPHWGIMHVAKYAETKLKMHNCS